MALSSRSHFSFTLIDLLQMVFLFQKQIIVSLMLFNHLPFVMDIGCVGSSMKCVYHLESLFSILTYYFYFSQDFLLLIHSASYEFSIPN
jgi:hypothetical protein